MLSCVTLVKFLFSSPQAPNGFLSMLELHCYYMLYIGYRLLTTSIRHSKLPNKALSILCHRGKALTEDVYFLSFVCVNPALCRVHNNNRETNVKAQKLVYGEERFNCQSNTNCSSNCE